MKRVLFAFVFAAQISLMSAQTLTIETVEVCAGQEVFVPVTATSMLNIGAITLYIGFDTNNLTFLSIENIDPQLAGMSSNYMPVQAQIAFAWSNTIPINFTTGKLFDLKFITNNNPGTIQFNAGCEVSDTTGTVINTVYTNGAVNPGMPVITLQPADTTVTEGSDSYFTVHSPNAYSYAWLESQDNGVSWLTLEENEIYSGTTTEILLIHSVSLSFNQNLYKCLVLRGNCNIYSGNARLSVDELTSAGTRISGTMQFRVNINPIPSGSTFKLHCTITDPTHLYLSIFNENGQQTESITYPSLPAGAHNITINSSAWKSGIYFLRIDAITRKLQSSQTMKLIKN